MVNFIVNLKVWRKIWFSCQYKRQFFPKDIIWHFYWSPEWLTLPWSEIIWNLVPEKRLISWPFLNVKQIKSFKRICAEPAYKKLAFSKQAGQFLMKTLNFDITPFKKLKNINVIDNTCHDVPYSYWEWITHHFILRINHKPISVKLCQMLLCSLLFSKRT